ncbi:MAG: hypothetical protein KF713_00070 [Turneriella sp.]|nr:hypothetical protein [Turneriella sp.]
MRRIAFFSSIFLVGFTLCSCKSWGKFWEVTLCDEGIGYAAMVTAS